MHSPCIDYILSLGHLRTKNDISSKLLTCSYVVLTGSAKDLNAENTVARCQNQLKKIDYIYGSYLQRQSCCITRLLCSKTRLTRLTWLILTNSPAYFCVLEVAVNARRCSIIQGCSIRNYMKKSGNSSYLVLLLNTSIVKFAGKH